MGEDKRDKAVKQAKLAEALRANLRRRKAGPAKPSAATTDEPKREG